MIFASLAGSVVLNLADVFHFSVMNNYACIFFYVPYGFKYDSKVYRTVLSFINLIMMYVILWGTILNKINLYFDISLSLLTYRKSRDQFVLIFSLGHIVHNPSHQCNFPTTCVSSFSPAFQLPVPLSTSEPGIFYLFFTFFLFPFRHCSFYPLSIMFDMDLWLWLYWRKFFQFPSCWVFLLLRVLKISNVFYTSIATITWFYFFYLLLI